MIGVFDSGFGGLAILKEIVANLPEHEYIYLADTARAPYGSRSSEVVYGFTKQAAEFLFAQGCELVLLACNTASAEALRQLQLEYATDPKTAGRKILGVVVPTIEEAVEVTKSKRIGVLATEGTVLSGAFVKEINKHLPEAKVFQNSAPLLVPLVEEGEHQTSEAKAILQRYLQPLLDENIDTLILGCTHYGHVAELVKEIVGSEVRVISQGEVIAKKLVDYLGRHPEIVFKSSNSGKVKFYSTDITDRFSRLGKLFYGMEIKSQKIELN